MRVLPVVLMAAGFAGAASGQEPPPGFQRTEAQQRYVERALAAPLPVVRIYPALGAAGPRTGVLFGSLGHSAAWSAGAREYLPQVWLRRVGWTHDGVRIQFGPPDGIFVNKGAGEDLQGAGEKVGLMAYGVFRLALEPGEYEIHEVVNWQGGIDRTSARRRENFKPVRFRIEAGVPAYAGRLAFIPRVVELPKMPVRPGWEHAGTQGGPTHKIDGFQVWVHDALESDRRLARIDAPATHSLIDTLVEQGGGFFRREVRYEEIDHNGINMH